MPATLCSRTGGSLGPQASRPVTLGTRLRGRTVRSAQLGPGPPRPGMNR
jgi:hypothetical protein